MIFIGIIIVILLVHFLIIRPLTQRNRPPIYEPRGNYYDQRNDYGTGRGGFGGVGTFAGGLAAGALLTYLLEHNRIGYDQYLSLQNLEDHEIMRELMDQNIIQEHEIDQLQEEIHGGDDAGGNDTTDDADYDDQDNQPNDDGGWDNGDDNWV